MSTKTQYHTRQQEELLSFLRSHPGHYTAADLCGHLGGVIGTTTVYRQLDRLVQAGLVTKYIIDIGSPACFEYAEHHEECFHCKCQQCGKLIHMHCHELPVLEQHILAHHGFAIDPARTVFYGLCRDCAQENAG